MLKQIKETTTNAKFEEDIDPKTKLNKEINAKTQIKDSNQIIQTKETTTIKPKELYNDWYDNKDNTTNNIISMLLAYLLSNATGITYADASKYLKGISKIKGKEAPDQYINTRLCHTTQKLRNDYAEHLIAWCGLRDFILQIEPAYKIIKKKQKKVKKTKQLEQQVDQKTFFCALYFVSMSSALFCKRTKNNHLINYNLITQILDYVNSCFSSGLGGTVIDMLSLLFNEIFSDEPLNVLQNQKLLVRCKFTDQKKQVTNLLQDLTLEQKQEIICMVYCHMVENLQTYIQQNTQINY